MSDTLLDGEPGKFGSGGDPVVSSKDMENKDGMIAKPSECLPAGASRGGTKVQGGVLGS